MWINFTPVRTVNGYYLTASRLIDAVTVTLSAPFDPAYKGYPRVAEAVAYVSQGDADAIALDLYYGMLDKLNGGAARDLPCSREFTRALLAVCYRAADAVLAA